MTTRDDFSEAVKLNLARRFGFECSNPDCHALTSGPQEDRAKAVNLGVAAHITVASLDGPRYAASLTPEQRQDISNGIWLCQNCAKLVDNDPARFTVTVLQEWKTLAEERARERVGRTASADTSDSRLGIELPEPMNPIGYRSSGRYTSAWRVKIRLIAQRRPLDIVDVGVTEEGVGAWIVREVFHEHTGRQVPRPIEVERSAEFWMEVESPRVSETKPTSMGRMTLWFRDHTGARHESVIDRAPLG